MRSLSVLPLLSFYAFISSTFTEGPHPAEKQRGSTPKLVVLPPAPLNFIPTGNEASRIAVHAVDRSSSHRESPPNIEDPLTEFYEKARAQRDQAVSNNNVAPCFST